MLGLRPQGVELRATGRVEEVVVRRLRGGGGEGGGESATKMGICEGGDAGMLMACVDELPS